MWKGKDSMICEKCQCDCNNYNEKEYFCPSCNKWFLQTDNNKLLNLLKENLQVKLEWSNRYEADYLEVKLFYNEVELSSDCVIIEIS